MNTPSDSILPGMDPINEDQLLSDIKKGIYPCLGIGSGREVFDLKNGYVLKVARNHKGLAQNKTESKIAKQETSLLLAKVVYISDNYRFLMMEKAKSISHMKEIWKYFLIKNNQQLRRLHVLQSLALRYGLILADLGRPENWGMQNGIPVVVDYGFTRDVRRKYYLRTWRRKRR